MGPVFYLLLHDEVGVLLSYSALLALDNDLGPSLLTLLPGWLRLLLLDFFLKFVERLSCNFFRGVDQL